MIKKNIFIFLIAGLLMVGLAPLTATAEKWPSKPITFIVSFPAGGTSDVVARMVGKQLAESLGQAVVVENKPGAGSIIGTEFVARAKSDGYTIGLVANSFAINPSLHHNLRYDTVGDFIPVSLLVYTHSCACGSSRCSG